MIQKERLGGSEVTFARTTIQAIRSFFGVGKPQGGTGKTISRFSPEYHLYRKKIVKEGRLTQWGGLTTGAEKEKIGIERMRERQKRENDF